MALAEDYVAALMAVSLVFRSYEEACGQSPVLVGGAATAIYTGGLFPSGDFDIVAGRDDAFDAAMLKHGFVPEDRLGKLKIGYYHPDHPTFGFQQVSGPCSMVYRTRTGYAGFWCPTSMISSCCLPSRT